MGLVWLLLLLVLLGAYAMRLLLPGTDRDDDLHVTHAEDDPTR